MPRDFCKEYAAASLRPGEPDFPGICAVSGRCFASNAALSAGSPDTGSLPMITRENIKRRYFPIEDSGKSSSINVMASRIRNRLRTQSFHQLHRPPPPIPMMMAIKMRNIRAPMARTTVMVIAAVPSSFRESEMFLLATGSAAIAVIL